MFSAARTWEVKWYIKEDIDSYSIRGQSRPGATAIVDKNSPANITGKQEGRY